MSTSNENNITDNNGGEVGQRPGVERARTPPRTSHEDSEVVETQSAVEWQMRDPFTDRGQQDHVRQSGSAPAAATCESDIQNPPDEDKTAGDDARYGPATTNYDDLSCRLIAAAKNNVPPGIRRYYPIMIRKWLDEPPRDGPDSLSDLEKYVTGGREKPSRDGI